MTRNSQPWKNSSGQALMMAVGVIALLVIAIVAVFLMNQTGAQHQLGGAQRTSTRSVAQDGVAYIIQQLSTTPTTWQNALLANFSGTDCNTGSDVISPSGGHFRLSCSTGSTGNPGLQPYEVAVTATASIPAGNGAGTPLRAIQAYLSRRTLGVDLATGLHAAAAFVMVSTPSIQGALNVEWGPAVSQYGSGIWMLTDPMDTNRSPRKFSVGGIAGTAYARTTTTGTGPDTDQLEYWAYAPVSFAPTIDESSYAALAQNEPGGIAITAPISLNSITAGSPSPVPTVGCVTANCGYFQPDPGDTAVFDGGGTGYSASGGVNGAVIYVNGSAQFRSISIDSATVIVTGGLALQGDTTSGSTKNLHVPRGASIEYPYASTYPCMGKDGDMTGGVPAYDCGSATDFGNIQFRGMLYVKGNLSVNTTGWNMVGVLWVGDPLAPLNTTGQVIIPTGNSLTLAYDDVINHSVKVLGPVKVVPDFIHDINVP